MPDDKPNSAAGESEAEDRSYEEQPDSSPDTQDGSEEGDQEQRIPLKRFREVNAKFKQAASVVEWYRQNIGDPSDVVEFRKWKQTQAQAETDKTQAVPDAKQPLSPAQLKAVRDLMRDADPEYREMLDNAKERQQERQQNEEAMYDDAHDEIVRLSKDNGLKLDEEGMVMLGRQVMLVIREDPKLIRAWKRGDIRCIEKAFGEVNEKFLSRISGRSVSLRQKEAAAKRRVTTLPTAPAGGAATTATTVSKAKDEKGITQKTHDRAWALLQQSMNE